MKKNLLVGLLLFVVILIGLVLRLYKLSLPLADHHSWRQSDSAAVIRNLVNDGFDILHPRWDNLLPTNQERIPNPERYFFEDFPLSFDIYPALIYRVVGENVTTLRAASIGFFILTLIALFFLARKISNSRIAIIAAFLFSVLPFSIFFTRGIFQENALNLYAVASLLFLILYLEQKKRRWFVLAIITNALLFLTKPYALIFLLPELGLFFKEEGMGFLKNRKTWAYFIISLLPFGLWWSWVANFPEGIPYSGWLFNEGNIRFKGAFFYWIFSQRLGILIMGIYGVLFFGLGILTISKQADGLFYLWLLSLIVYVSIIAKGNVTHDYYQIPFLPVIVYFMAKGIDFFWLMARGLRNKLFTVLIIFVFLSFSLAFSWYEVRSFYDLQSGVDLAADFINKNTPKNVLVIAGDGADSTLLYNTNRLGWTVGYGSVLENSQKVIEKLRANGASFYVTSRVNQIRNTDFDLYMRKNYPILKETNQFVVFSLTPKD